MERIRNFVTDTNADLRGGRESWRVLALFWSAASVISTVMALVRR
jgi:hypothetical protein